MGLASYSAGLISLAIFGCVGAAAPPAFEVASIRPDPGPWRVLHTYRSSGPRLTLEGYYLFDLVTEAYHLKNYQVILAKSVPEKLALGTYYNVVAKAEGNRTPTKQEFRQMLQNLLAQRCSLAVHRTTKEMPVYALVAGKNGPKFKETPPDTNEISHFGVNGRNQNFTLFKASMDDVAGSIQSAFGVDRPVLDKTGLTGEYTVKLEATPEYVLSRGDPQTGDVSVFRAVQEQLGLKLESQKADIEVLIVDHIDKPTEN